MRAGEESGAQNNGARRRPAGDGGCSGAASGLALPIIELGEAEGGVESSGHEKMPFTVRPRGWTTATGVLITEETGSRCFRFQRWRGEATCLIGLNVALVWA